jgi:hypothetical protein
MKKILHACFFTIVFMSVSDLNAMYLLQSAMERLGIWDKQDQEQDQISTQDAKVPAKDDEEVIAETKDVKTQIDGEARKLIEGHLEKLPKTPEDFVIVLGNIFGLSTKEGLKLGWVTPEFAATGLKEKSIEGNALKNDQGSKPLHIAASYGWDIICRTLLLAGAELHCHNNRHAVPLGLAGIAGRTSTCKLLILQYYQTNQDEKLKDFKQYPGIVQALKELASEKQKS